MSVRVREKRKEEIVSQRERERERERDKENKECGDLGYFDLFIVLKRKRKEYV